MVRKKNAAFSKHEMSVSFPSRPEAYHQDTSFYSTRSVYFTARKYSSINISQQILQPLNTNIYIKPLENTFLLCISPCQCCRPETGGFASLLKFWKSGLSVQLESAAPFFFFFASHRKYYNDLQRHAESKLCCKRLSPGSTKNHREKMQKV